nr:MAG TPA: hypothetical protein [Caudoviricetes sp.]
MNLMLWLQDSRKKDENYLNDSLKKMYHRYVMVEYMVYIEMDS